MDEARPTILVVEDEPIIRMDLADHIANHGYDVVEAGSGDKALEILQAGKPVDLLITDVQMPGTKDGIDLALWVRHNLPSVKIMIVSGAMTGSPSLDKLGSEGLIIPKPYSMNALLDRIKCLLAYRTTLPGLSVNPNIDR